MAVKCRWNNRWANATGTGATTATYTPSSATAGTTYYRVLVNAANNDCQQAVSNNATAMIIPDLVVTTQPTNVNECVGGTDQMTVVVSGGSGSISYQWQSSTDGSTAGRMQQEQEQQQHIYTSQCNYQEQHTTEYWLMHTNSDCQQAVSAVVTAIIIPDLVVTTQPTNVNECVGGTDQMTVVVSGGSGTISYQWQSSTDGTSGWANATGTGATTATYTPSSATAGTTYYRVLVNATDNDCQQAVSNSGDSDHHT